MVARSSWNSKMSRVQYNTLAINHKKVQLQVEFPWYFILQKLENERINIYTVFQVPANGTNMEKHMLPTWGKNAIYIELFVFLQAAASPVLSYLLIRLQAVFRA